MKLEIIGQPYRDWTSGGSFVTAMLKDPKVRRVVIATAWVRESGMAVLAPGLTDLRARGGRVTMFVGVDLHGTTHQGLELARASVDQLFVVHDPESRTFHPKLYLGVGGNAGYALIGSNNLTAAGMEFNYEGAVLCSFNPRIDSGFVAGIDAYVDRIRRDSGICRRVTPAVLKRLRRENWLADEVTDRRHRHEDRTKRARARGRGSPLFPGSSVEKRRATFARRAGTRSKRVPTRIAAAMAVAPDSWAKQLGAGEAQHPRKGHRTGVVRLTPPRKRTDRATFFRDVFFADEDWRSDRDRRGNPTEVAEPVFEAEVDGRSLGTHALKVVYAAHRDKRGRATTVLHWGGLRGELRARDRSGSWLLIERGAGTHRLSIQRTRPV